ncbi:MAG: hypothetical protein HQL42_12870 [Alphaproteobacteria bacterium]|nr:hypothetical protein [Alphaproteobacteria bacterium]
MEPTKVSLSALDILLMVIGTGSFSAAVTALLAWLKDFRKDKAATKRDASYLALRVAVVLERFSFDCAGYISDIETFSSSSGHAGAQRAMLPDLLPYPADLDWKVLDLGLAGRALSLPNEFELADRAIAFWFEIDNECVPQACRDQCGICGLRAWELAAALRKKYGLPEFDLKSVGWGIVDLLQETRDAAVARTQAER